MGSWAAWAIDRLEQGKRVTIRPKGFSMEPKIKSGAEVLLDPIRSKDSLEVGDIVLVRVAGRVYLHLVSSKDRGRVQISNNRGNVNGWVSNNAVMGRAIKITNNPPPRKNDSKPKPIQANGSKNKR